jgi:MFS transporter, AAHS family, 4-hydroxybenzoate transporter
METSSKAMRANVRASRVIDVQQLLDEQPVGRFQILALLMCMFMSRSMGSTP